MASEKSRYLFKNRGPESPFHIKELSEKLKIVGVEDLAELIWVRAQYDDVLCKAAMAASGIRHANGDWKKITKAIDYAVHFPDHVRYTKRGHGQIICEIKSALDSLILANKYELAIKAAVYTIEKAEEVAQNFENDWDWASSIEELVAWIKLHQGYCE